MAATFTFRARMGTAAVVLGAVAASGCGEFVRQSRSPSQLVINSIETARGTGTVPTTFVSGPLLSDVSDATGTIFDDFGRVSLSAILRDQGVTTPSDVNDVTITRYRVVYRRADRPNAQGGVDVPHPFDGGLTLTVPARGTPVTAVFELVRHIAKAEAPLIALRSNAVVISTIAEVTFFGRDQAGNEVSVTGTVLINFANFG